MIARMGDEEFGELAARWGKLELSDFLVATMMLREARRARESEAAALALLKQTEWAEIENETGNTEGLVPGWCPFCRNHKSSGHALGCRWAEMLEGK